MKRRELTQSQTHLNNLSPPTFSLTQTDETQARATRPGSNESQALWLAGRAEEMLVEAKPKPAAPKD